MPVRGNKDFRKLIQVWLCKYKPALSLAVTSSNKKIRYRKKVFDFDVFTNTTNRADKLQRLWDFILCVTSDLFISILMLKNRNAVS